MPQWNCNGPVSARARNGDPAVRPRTQASLAVTADDRRWILLDASPDLRAQMAANPQLHPPANGPRRASPISAVFASGADVDKIAGLLHLREGHPFVFFAAPPTLKVVAQNPIFNALDPDTVPRRPLPLEREFSPQDAQGESLGFRMTAFPVAGKVPLFMEAENLDPQAPAATAADGEAVGFRIADPDGAAFFHIPGCAQVTPALAARLRGADLAFVDGTLFRDDEMQAQGLGEKTGRRMGHVSMSGPEGAMAALAEAEVRRRIFIHINNSNPALADDSPERAEVERAGWEVARDGMEITL